MDNPTREDRDEKLIASRQSGDIFCILVALICITAIELYALHQGVNGFGLSASTGAICLILGVSGRNLADFMRGKR